MFVIIGNCACSEVHTNNFPDYVTILVINIVFCLLNLFIYKGKMRFPIEQMFLIIIINYDKNKHVKLKFTYSEKVLFVMTKFCYIYLFRLNVIIPPISRLKIHLATYL